MGCKGYARFDSIEQAEYVAKGHTNEFGTIFRVVQHDEHWHVIDTGDIVGM